jgi:hypothetical protein
MLSRYGVMLCDAAWRVRVVLFVVLLPPAVGGADVGLQDVADQSLQLRDLPQFRLCIV